MLVKLLSLDFGLLLGKIGQFWIQESGHADAWPGHHRYQVIVVVVHSVFREIESNLTEKMFFFQNCFWQLFVTSFGSIIICVRLTQLSFQFQCLNQLFWVIYFAVVVWIWWAILGPFFSYFLSLQYNLGALNEFSNDCFWTSYLFVLHDHHAMPISLFDELFRQEYYEVYPLAMLS